jgi:hypothetical protein
VLVWPRRRRPASGEERVRRSHYPCPRNTPPAGVPGALRDKERRLNVASILGCPSDCWRELSPRHYTVRQTEHIIEVFCRTVNQEFADRIKSWPPRPSPILSRPPVSAATHRCCEIQAANIVARGDSMPWGSTLDLAGNEGLRSAAPATAAAHPAAACHWGSDIDRPAMSLGRELTASVLPLFPSPSGCPIGLRIWTGSLGFQMGIYKGIDAKLRAAGKRGRYNLAHRRHDLRRPRRLPLGRRYLGGLLWSSAGDS